MRILFVAPFVPVAQASSGGSAYVAALAHALAERASLGLVALSDATTPATMPKPPWSWLATARTPLGNGRSMRQRLCTLWHWRCLPLVAAKARHAEVPTLLARALAEFAPDVALVEMAQMAQYLPWLRGVPTILTDHEAGCPANTHTGLGDLGDRRDRRLWRRFAERYFPLATALQAVTADDAATLQQMLHRPVQARPPTVDVPAHPVAPGAAPPRALFLGDYRHGPNPEAARRLACEVLPRIRAANPAAELWLAGPHQERIADLAQLDGVKVLGFVPDLAQLFGQVRLLLAPLWSGHGFRVKVMTALAHGLPVVTNELGARGCSAPPPALTVAGDLAALAAASLTLLRPTTDAALAGRAAHEWALGHLRAEHAAEWQLARIRALVGQPTA